MDEIAKRIKHRGSRKKVMTAQDGAMLFRDRMVVATSGNPLMGYPKATFLALAERIKREGSLKIDLLCAGPLGPEVEDALAEVGGIGRRIGAIGGEKLRNAINKGEVSFFEGKGCQLPLQVKRGWFGPVHLAVIEAVGLTEEGFIIPSTAVYDTPEWLEAARAIIVEINLRRPLTLAGLHDVYQKAGEPIPIAGDPLKRIGLPYFTVDHEKIAGIVLADLPDRLEEAGKPDARGELIAGHLIDFFRRELAAGRIGDRLPPIELGVGDLAAQVMRKIGESDLGPFRFHLPAITDPILEIVEAGKVEWVSGMALRLTPAAWQRFEKDIEVYKRLIVLRPVTICNSAEVIQRLGVIGINGCLEMDIQGQVNSSHVLGSKILTGIAGSYDFSRNGLYSIFVGPSTTRGGQVSAIVPLVAHVDHTEHDVDILVTEQGLADLRGLDPHQRAERIIEKCAHKDFQGLLRDYLAQALSRPGHIPLSLEEAFSFHLRFQQSGSMKRGE